MRARMAGVVGEDHVCQDRRVRGAHIKSSLSEALVMAASAEPQACWTSAENGREVLRVSGACHLVMLGHLAL